MGYGSTYVLPLLVLTVSLSSIRARLGSAEAFSKALDWAAGARQTDALYLQGLTGSLPSFLLHRLHEALDRPLCCFAPDADDADFLYSDLQQLGLTEATDVLRFPATGHAPYNTEQVPDTTPVIQRADALQQLSEGFDGVLVTSVEAAFDLVPPAEAVRNETLHLQLGDEHDPEALVERLTGQGFRRVEFVEEPGEMALRGGILDVFPFASTYPLRIEFFGDEIDSIREFDVANQRSVSRKTSARIVPDLEGTHPDDGEHRPLTSYLPDDTLLVTFNEDGFAEQVEALFEEAATNYAARQETADDEDTHLPTPDSRFLTPDALSGLLLQHPRLVLGTFAGTQVADAYPMDAQPQPAFASKMKLLRQQIRENDSAHIDTFILCDSRSQRDRLQELLEEQVLDGQVQLKVASLHAGFEVPDLSLAVYTDHQIFDRYHRPTAGRKKQRTSGLTLRQLKNLDPGDFVVHIDYGVGRFSGLQKITVRGKQQEAVKVYFRDDDVLYVNVNALYKLSKYTGKEGHQPKLTKLGSGQWERTKAKTKKEVKKIARDLIKLYAKRKASQGYAFSSDTVWQREMEASFQFEDTPDQAEAARAVKRDMEEPVPMDRLVCGDVGFGKTEVAIRAAFKAVQDGKQVAVLVPTTILATQHYETFRKRLDAFPVTVELLSRFRTSAQQKEVLQGLNAGTVDIVIGTHRLTSNDIEFNDLGLFVIDEEQRFGVKAKEKLRKLRVSVDTLTLTATPIPRTLQFSLLGARDLSIIATPPTNRQAIVTEIHTFDDDLIRDAIHQEISRGGQVFFIHNRVQTIQEIAELIRALVPDIRVRVGHGQMGNKELEEVMLEFINGEFDVLVSTTIIENGLDISNANTIIMNHAERFGLSGLHQLRGRVGRSNRKAFCYLLVPSVHSLTREARQRLQAVEEFNELGSGFNIAMRDLDIRGAGSLLGAQQSGFIADVGYDTYHKILDDAVQELRAEEFADVFDADEAIPPAPETQVDVEEDAYIPEDYLANNVERLNLYRRISEATDEAALQALRDEFADRFGAPPVEVDNLIRAAELKLQIHTLRLTKVLYKNERLFLYFPTQDADPYFYEAVFHDLLAKLSELDRRYVLKETRKGTLRAIIQDVPSLEAAQAITGRLRLENEAVPA